MSDRFVCEANVDSFTLNKIEFDAVRAILSRYCRCGLGRELARRIGPSRNPAVIREWLEQVSQMVAALRDVGLPPFGGVVDITAALERATPGAGASAEDFLVIAGTLEGAMNVRRYLLSLPESLPLLHAMAGGIGEFQSEIDAVHAVIDPDGIVSDRASHKLAEVRRHMADTAQAIHSLIHSYVRQSEVAKLLQEAVVTLHGDRYVLPVKAENRGRLPGVVHRASHSGATVFVEPEACVQLNNRLSDLAEDERREIQRLLSQLALRIFAVADRVRTTLHSLAHIDVLTAKAQYAYQFNFTCPEITERGPLVFHQARHPLLIEQTEQRGEGILPASGNDGKNLAPSTSQGDGTHNAGEMPASRCAATPAVVPIDIRLGQDFDVLIITGSNTGGKTVALKTVALLVVMAQSGMHIPVRRGAIMPAYRDVFIDIGDEQSLEQSLSTFGAHIKRVRYILHKADAASLVLLDELGSGTDPDEGGAIGQAILDEIRRVGCACIVTTHLSVLKAYAYANERVDNASVAFNSETLRPTYHLLIGTPGESHAISVAAHLGLPRRIVGASRQYLNQQGKQFRRAIQATSIVRQDAEQARAAAAEAQLAAQTQQVSYEVKLADLRRLQEEFNLWLAGLGELKEGDDVFVPSLRRMGRLVRLELHRQIAVVNADPLQIEVPLRELMPDLGQEAVRGQINAVRQQMHAQAAASEQAAAQATHAQKELERSLREQKERSRQFDAWLARIGEMKVGDEVTLTKLPGNGTLTSVDFARGKAKVQTIAGELEVTLQELFPQESPFAKAGREADPARGRHGPRHGDRSRHGESTPRDGDSEPAAPQPMHRRSPQGRSKEHLDKLLAVQPGQQVYVVPFHKRATLLRINPDKQHAVVQSGAFELEIPLTDLEPVRE
ncbi:MAG: hypothetical protein FWE88_04055 [Phycisphaerae bacterium]|nr:hypothetical protein [Phycisphaerae bacterium]